MKRNRIKTACLRSIENKAEGNGKRGGIAGITASMTRFDKRTNGKEDGWNEDEGFDEVKVSGSEFGWGIKLGFHKI